MSLVITTSPNISVFDYLVNIDLTTNKINLNDNSTYIGGGAALVKGIDFVITNQVGTLIWSNTNFTTPDINPAAPATFTKPLPTFNGMLEWGNYTVVGTIKDQDGTLYTLKKQLNICKPPQNDVTTGNYGIASIMYRIDCADAKIILGDYTTYVYNGVTGISTVAWTVYQPPTLNLAPISATAPYVNISPIYLGDYTVLFQSSATYNFGNGWTVIVGYTATAKFPVQCDVNLCDVYCELEKVVKQYETTANLSPSAAQDLKNIIDTATVEIELIQIGIACGKDVSSHKQVLKDILGVDGDFDLKEEQTQE